ncbi:Cadherin-24 [Chelonia mydas]|uniref:Cadherin-24 n=1 Tax=Chelonia mydas TaxID=8469 RepID=M7B4Z0_CHEMY|nr:Cadherin-24 [Chelonia mydas]
MPSILGLLLTWLGGYGCAGRLGPPWPGSRGAPTQGWERPLLRSRRSWVWNQFFVIEEYAGPEPVLIGRLHSDVDRGEGRFKYVLTGEGAGTVFVIDERTGNVHVTKTLDREEKAQYTLLAQAVDRASNRPLEPPSQFIIKVQDINDNPPVFPHGPYHDTVPEVPEMSNVGTPVIQVTAQDAADPSYGNSAKLVYTVLEGLPFFSVDPQTRVVRTAIPNMDREAQAELLVVIQAKDMGGHAGGLSGSVTVTVTLSDVNDNPPKFPQNSPAWAAPVPVAVHALDVNDNVPQLAPGTEPFICHGAAPGQKLVHNVHNHITNQRRFNGSESIKSSWNIGVVKFLLEKLRHELVTSQHNYTDKELKGACVAYFLTKRREYRNSLNPFKGLKEKEEKKLRSRRYRLCYRLDINAKHGAKANRVYGPPSERLPSAEAQLLPPHLYDPHFQDREEGEGSGLAPFPPPHKAFCPDLRPFLEIKVEKDE